jgi:hypothetical protein
VTPLEELAQFVREGGRRIFVAEQTVDLSKNDGTNGVYVLELPSDSPGAAGGRVGGVGERRLRKVHCYRLQDEKWIKAYETNDPERLQRYELPYHAAGLSIVLPDGTEKVVSGVVDEEFIRAYNESA